MTDLKCDVCGYVGHESSYKQVRGHIRYECPNCGTSKDNAYEVESQEEHDD